MSTLNNNTINTSSTFSSSTSSSVNYNYQSILNIMNSENSQVNSLSDGLTKASDGLRRNLGNKMGNGNDLGVVLNVINSQYSQLLCNQNKMIEAMRCLSEQNTYLTEMCIGLAKEFEDSIMNEKNTHDQHSWSHRFTNFFKGKKDKKSNSSSSSSSDELVLENSTTAESVALTDPSTGDGVIVTAVENVKETLTNVVTGTGENVAVVVDKVTDVVSVTTEKIVGIASQNSNE